jgi:hypothetical protein
MSKRKKPKPTWQNGNDAQKHNQKKKKRIPPQTWQDGDDAMKHGQQKSIFGPAVPHVPPDPTAPHRDGFIKSLVSAAADGELSQSDITNLKHGVNGQIENGGLSKENLRHRFDEANRQLAEAGNIYRVVLREYGVHEKPTHVGVIVSYHLEMAILDSVKASEIGKPVLIAGVITIVF